MAEAIAIIIVGTSVSMLALLVFTAVRSPGFVRQIERRAARASMPEEQQPPGEPPSVLRLIAAAVIVASIAQAGWRAWRNAAR